MFKKVLFVGVSLLTFVGCGKKAAQTQPVPPNFNRPGTIATILQQVDKLYEYNGTDPLIQVIKTWGLELDAKLGVTYYGVSTSVSAGALIVDLPKMLNGKKIIEQLSDQALIDLQASVNAAASDAGF